MLLARDGHEVTVVERNRHSAQLADDVPHIPAPGQPQLLRIIG
jgi:hypothetical protein